MKYNSEKEKRIGEFLIKMGILTAEQVTQILDRQRILKVWKKFGAIAIELGYLTPDGLKKFLKESKN